MTRALDEWLSTTEPGLPADSLLGCVRQRFPLAELKHPETAGLGGPIRPPIGCPSAPVVMQKRCLPNKHLRLTLPKEPNYSVE